MKISEFTVSKIATMAAIDDVSSQPNIGLIQTLAWMHRCLNRSFHISYMADVEANLKFSKPWRQRENMEIHYCLNHSLTKFMMADVTDILKCFSQHLQNRVSDLPLKHQSQLQQTANFAASFQILEKIIRDDFS